MEVVRVLPRAVPGEVIQHAAPQTVALMEREAGMCQHRHRSKRTAVSLNETS